LTNNFLGLLVLLLFFVVIANVIWVMCFWLLIDINLEWPIPSKEHFMIKATIKIWRILNSMRSTLLKDSNKRFDSSSAFR
jgi:hypothetical protein